MKTWLISLLLMACLSSVSVGITSDYEKRIDCVVFFTAAEKQDVDVGIESVDMQQPHQLKLEQEQAITNLSLFAIHNRGHGGDLHSTSESDILKTTAANLRRTKEPPNISQANAPRIRHGPKLG